MTSDTGAWRQTIFYPYMHASVFGNGTVLNTIVKSPVYDSKSYTDVPYIDSVCIMNEETEELVIFAVNKDLEEDIELSCDLRQFADYGIVEHILLTHDDVKAENTEANPDNVAPVTCNHSKNDNGKFTALLKSKSWNVIRMKKIH